MGNFGTKITETALARLRQRREALGLSQATVASAVGVNPSYIGLLERGERVPSLEVLLAMCEAVELTPAELFADAGPKRTKEPAELAQVRALFSTWPGPYRKAGVRLLKELDRLRRA